MRHLMTHDGGQLRVRGGHLQDPLVDPDLAARQGEGILLLAGEGGELPSLRLDPGSRSGNGRDAPADARHPLPGGLIPGWLLVLFDLPEGLRPHGDHLGFGQHHQGLATRLRHGIAPRGQQGRGCQQPAAPLPAKDLPHFGLLTRRHDEPLLRPA